MKKSLGVFRLVAVLSCLLLIPWIVSAQEDIVIFDENDEVGDVYYDASWGYSWGGSELTLLGPGSDKMPIDTIHSYAGSESGIIEWISGPGGEWSLFIADDGWTAHDAEGYGGLSFYLNGPTAISGTNLPKIGLGGYTGRKNSLATIICLSRRAR